MSDTLSENYSKLNKRYQEIKNQLADIEAKLAEKDKEISNLNGLIRERDKQIKNLKTNKKRVIEHKNNVKISFCIEQLEKVKDYAQHIQGGLINYIDNQINGLKGEETIWIRQDLSIKYLFGIYHQHEDK